MTPLTEQAQARIAERKPDDKGQRDPHWSMPEWMEPYRELMESRLGGSSVERLMNLTGKQTWGNSILAALCCMAEAQVTLLIQLRRDEKLR